jgi:hypothetical protein
MMSELRVRLQLLRHRHMTALLQQMGRVFNVQRDTDMRQQGNGTVAGDPDKLDRETAA